MRINIKQIATGREYGLTPASANEVKVRLEALESPESGSFNVILDDDELMLAWVLKGRNSEGEWGGDQEMIEALGEEPERGAEILEAAMRDAGAPEQDGSGIDGGVQDQLGREVVSHWVSWIVDPEVVQKVVRNTVGDLQTEGATLAEVRDALIEALGEDELEAAVRGAEQIVERTKLGNLETYYQDPEFAVLAFLYASDDDDLSDYKGDGIRVDEADKTHFGIDLWIRDLDDYEGGIEDDLRSCDMFWRVGTGCEVTHCDLAGALDSDEFYEPAWAANAPDESPAKRRKAEEMEAVN